MDEDTSVELDEDKARGGVTSPGHKVLTVLLVSTGAILLIFAGFALFMR
jgi:hypothetical protein